jgi:Leucine-rich repeat (LRR) protein
LEKIELRCDTSCHNLQVTGETLKSLIHLRLNDSIIKSFRDLGTGFQYLQILDVSRCELKEIYGMTAFPNLEELYANFNEIDELYDI